MSLNTSVWPNYLPKAQTFYKVCLQVIIPRGLGLLWAPLPLFPGNYIWQNAIRKFLLIWSQKYPFSWFYSLVLVVSIGAKQQSLLCHLDHKFSQNWR